MRTHMTYPLDGLSPLFWLAAWGLSPAMTATQQGHSKRPPEPLLNLGIGTYWVYVDSVWGEHSITVRTDTVTVVDTVRDSLGFGWILPEDMRGCIGGSLIGRYDRHSGNRTGRTHAGTAVVAATGYALRCSVWSSGCKCWSGECSGSIHQFIPPQALLTAPLLYR